MQEGCCGKSQAAIFFVTLYITSKYRHTSVGTKVPHDNVWAGHMLCVSTNAMGVCYNCAQASLGE